jgi:pimeloyl-ACP methyl ester carboxylesterase
MVKVRKYLGEYLREADAQERETILGKIASEEAGTIETTAKILKGMKPVFPIQQKPVEGKSGYFVLTTPAYDDHPPFVYRIQLPPEYDPNRRYPLIVTLNGETTPDQQMDWWAGDWRNQQRYGQAARFGYIVMSPVWNIDNLPEYDFSARSHAAVLYSYYDVLRHFSIDVDRVFLTGHSFGGDAAWDIGISHPDLWAGVIPIAATGRKYIQAYAANARLIPLYFVNGEIDGMVGLDDNIAVFNAYLTARTASHYNCTVVCYIGRGHEGFSDEIQHLFDWMGRQTRQFPRKEFEARSLRAWDNFFWWYEGERFPGRSTLEPLLWSQDGPPPGYRMATIKGNITSQNSVRLTSSAGKNTIWLSPELMNFNAPMEILLNNRRVNTLKGIPQGNLRDMLEDVRTRFDRQHPFWLKVVLK